ncbi:MAG: endolytic transglycosylase MltG [Sulfuricellaceae bacterium]
MIKSLFKLIFTGVLLVAGWLGYFALTPSPLPQTPYEFDIKHGSSLRTVARQFADDKLIIEPWSFEFLVRMFGKANDIKAGNYMLDKEISPYRLFLAITRGDVTQSQAAFIEGWTFRQMRKALDENSSVRHDTLNLTEQEILQRLEAEETVAEGLFFPDTYFFSSGMSDISILKRANRMMRNRLGEAWQGRAPDLPYSSPYEALIMASIVEKETAQASERPMIASVFINRLRLGMRLQTDPTVIYGLGAAFDGNLHKHDLTGDTPYNTYTRSGLPPSPIAMPGGESLQAALHPAKSSALYFVAKGNGAHQFSNSLAEHNRAVARYQKRATN